MNKGEAINKRKNSNKTSVAESECNAAEQSALLKLFGVLECEHELTLRTFRSFREQLGELLVEPELSLCGVNSQH